MSSQFHVGDKLRLVPLPMDGVVAELDDGWVVVHFPAINHSFAFWPDELAKRIAMAKEEDAQ